MAVINVQTRKLAADVCDMAQGGVAAVKERRRVLEPTTESDYV
jgi:hypothetical protein